MARDSVEIKHAMLNYLQSLPTVVALLTNQGTDIKETHWQGTEFSFPAIRVSVDLYPSLNGCGPDKADFVIETFSAQKSSLECDQLSGIMYKLLHKHAFQSIGLKFSTVIVTKVIKADVSIYGWRSQLFLSTQVV